MRKMFLLAVMTLLAMTSLPARAAGFDKQWSREPDWSKVPPEKAVIAIIIGENEYPNLTIAEEYKPDGTVQKAFHPDAERSALLVDEGLSFTQVDGVMFFGNTHATRANIDAFIDSLPKVDTILAYIETAGAGELLGDPQTLLKDSADYDKGYRPAALKKKLAEKSYRQAIISVTHHPGEIRGKDGAKESVRGPTAAHYYENGSEVNGYFLSPKDTCPVPVGAMLKDALIIASSTGKDITYADFTKAVDAKAKQAGCEVQALYSGDTTAGTVLFTGSGIAAVVEQSPPLVTSAVEQPPIPVKTLKPPPSAFMRQLPKFAVGGALVLGGVGSFIGASSMGGDEAWAREHYSTNEEYLTDMRKRQPTHDALVGTALGGVLLGAASITWGGVSLTANVTTDSSDIRVTTTW